MWSVAIKNTFISVELAVGAGLASLPGRCQRRARSADVATRRHMVDDVSDELRDVLRSDVQYVEVADLNTGKNDMTMRTLSDIGRCDGSSTSLSTIAPELTGSSSDEDDDWVSIEEMLLLTVDSEVDSPAGSNNTRPQRKFAQMTKPNDRVPKKVDLAAEFEKRMEKGPIATVMIRNVPNRYSQRALIKEFEGLGLAGTFDFVYIPLDLRTMSNVGYAFVNFMKPADASRCAELLQGHRMRRQAKAGKEVAVSVAHIQGLDANLRHYENSTVGKSRLKQRRPIVLLNGQEVAQ